MNQQLFYPEVECSSTLSTFHHSEIVGVLDETGNCHYLRIAQGYVNHLNGKSYLPVYIVEVDSHPRNPRVLAQLPDEADSGANRIWVPLASFRVASTVGENVA